MTVVGILSNFFPLLKVNFNEKVLINEFSKYEEAEIVTEDKNSKDKYNEDSENSSYVTESEEELSSDPKSEDWVSLNTK
tara:strand:+ start:3223 stop:3459 length:237 start_codon:yes stop_codon:yes gene_type:complete